MKKILTVGLFLTGFAFVFAQKVISIEAEGNLESPDPLDCVELSEVTNNHNPADILNGMRKCIEIKDFEKAAKLFALGSVYGTYDSYRVEDKTAHQAILVILDNNLSDISNEDEQAFVKNLHENFEKGSEKLNVICQEIQNVGIPAYYPRYMIQHGINAFLDEDGDGLVEGFNSEESWELVLKDYLHCGE
ncbi:MAG: hypothetical protein WBF83_06035 [Moheibacter sp.]